MSSTEGSGLSKRATTVVLAGLALMAVGIVGPFGRSVAGLFLIGGAAVMLAGLVWGLVVEGGGRRTGYPGRE